MADEGSRSVEKGKLGSPGIGTSVLTLVAACFALVTFARGIQQVWEYPYLSLEDPARTIFLRAEYERRVAKVWPPGVPCWLGSLGDSARAFKELGEEAWRAEARLPGGERDPADEIAVALRVVAAGWGEPESIAALRSTSEGDVPEYLISRFRELRRGDTQADHARALVARRWNASVLISDVLAMGGALLASVLLWRRRRAFAGAVPSMGPVIFGPAQSWVVLSWSFAALALAWRLAYAEVPLLGEIGRTFPSLILALVAFLLVSETRSSESQVPLKRLLSLPSDGATRKTWFLLGVFALGTSVGFAYVLNYALDALGVHSPWGEFLTEPLIHGSGYLALTTTLELVVFAPFGEELLFRGVLFGALASKLSPHRAALVSAVAFSVWHGYGVAGSLILVMDGYLLALLSSRTRSLVPGMIVHGTLNAIVCLENFGCRV